MEKLSVKTNIVIRKRVASKQSVMSELELVMRYQEIAALELMTAVVYQVGGSHDDGEGRAGC